MPNRVGRWAGPTLAVVSAWCFAFSGPMARYLNAAGLTPMETAWVRMAGAGVLLTAALAVFRPRALRIPRQYLLFTVAYGVIAVATVQALFFQAIARLPVGVALLIEYTAPVLVVLWVRFVRRLRLPPSAYAGAVVAIVGLGVVVEVWQGLVLDGSGLLLAFGAAACCAGYFLLSDAFGAEMNPLGLIAWGLLGAAVALVPLARPWAIDWTTFGEAVTLGGHTLPVLGAALWMILIATVTAYATGVIAVRLLSAAVAATMATLEVVAGAVIAWVLLGETLGLYQIVGGLIVITGALLAQRATAHLPRHAADRPRAPITMTG